MGGTTTLFDRVIVDRDDLLIWADRGCRGLVGELTVHALGHDRTLPELAFGPPEHQPRVDVMSNGSVLPTETLLGGVWRDDIQAAAVTFEVRWDAAPPVTGWRFDWAWLGISYDLGWSESEQRAYAELLARAARLRVPVGAG